MFRIQKIWSALKPFLPGGKLKSTETSLREISSKIGELIVSRDVFKTVENFGGIDTASLFPEVVEFMAEEIVISLPILSRLGSYDSIMPYSPRDYVLAQRIAHRLDLRISLPDCGHLEKDDSVIVFSTQFVDCGDLEVVVKGILAAGAAPVCIASLVNLSGEKNWSGAGVILPVYSLKTAN